MSASDIETQASTAYTPPFANCGYALCDLPGQCRAEGRCHHPLRIAVPESADSSKLLAVAAATACKEAASALRDAVAVIARQCREVETLKRAAEVSEQRGINGDRAVEHLEAVVRRHEELEDRFQAISVQYQTLLQKPRRSAKRKSDLEFLKQMLERFDSARNRSDTTQYDYVREMIVDWIAELEG